MPASRIRPKTDVSHGPRIGLRQNERRNGPGSSLARWSWRAHGAARRACEAGALWAAGASWGGPGLWAGRALGGIRAVGGELMAGVGHAAPPDRRGRDCAMDGPAAVTVEQAGYRGAGPLAGRKPHPRRPHPGTGDRPEPGVRHTGQQHLRAAAVVAVQVGGENVQVGVHLDDDRAEPPHGHCACGAPPEAGDGGLVAGAQHVGDRALVRHAGQPGHEIQTGIGRDRDRAAKGADPGRQPYPHGPASARRDCAGRPEAAHEDGELDDDQPAGQGGDPVPGAACPPVREPGPGQPVQAISDQARRAGRPSPARRAAPPRGRRAAGR